MFSNSLKYLIKALTFLAVNSNEENLYSIGGIAKEAGVPAAYLGKLLHTLSKEKIVTSNKGPGGGFYLSDENRKIKLGQVVFLIDGEEKFGSCLLGFEKCNLKNPCRLHDVYANLKYNFISKLETINIGDLASTKL